MTHFHDLPLELIAAILDYLDISDVRNTLRTAKSLRHPSEKRLYHSVALPTDRHSAEGHGTIHTRFLETISRHNRLARHVVKLVLGDANPPGRGDPDINRFISDAMETMINLKELEIYGYPYISHAYLDSVPFSLTNLVISTKTYDKEAPTPDLLPILQAHPNLEELALDCLYLPKDLVATLKAERNGLVPQKKILCPKLKRFEGYDSCLLLFLPMRKIDIATSLGCGTRWSEYGEGGQTGGSSFLLDPVVIQSFQHLRVLEVWPACDWTTSTHSFPNFAVHLTSLIHIKIVEDVRAFNYRSDLTLPALSRIQSLQSVTLATGRYPGLTIMDLRDSVGNVCNVLPDIQEIFVGADRKDLMYYRYVKGEGIQVDLVDRNVACWPYARWLRDS